VSVGEEILVNPGERVPLDGEVREGFSALDLSALTGEALPRDVVAGSEVLAGGVNLTGVLRLRVTRAYGQTRWPHSGAGAGRRFPQGEKPKR
jgi:Cd2+/Zn2+-exporting ATPase